MRRVVVEDDVRPPDELHWNVYFGQLAIQARVPGQAPVVPAEVDPSQSGQQLIPLVLMIFRNKRCN